MSDETTETPKRSWAFNIVATCLVLAILALVATLTLHKAPPTDDQTQTTESPSVDPNTQPQPATNDDPFRIK